MSRGKERFLEQETHRRHYPGVRADFSNYVVQAPPARHTSSLHPSSALNGVPGQQRPRQEVQGIESGPRTVHAGALRCPAAAMRDRAAPVRWPVHTPPCSPLPTRPMLEPLHRSRAEKQLVKTGHVLLANSCSGTVYLGQFEEYIYCAADQTVRPSVNCPSSGLELSTAEMRRSDRQPVARSQLAAVYGQFEQLSVELPVHCPDPPSPHTRRPTLGDRAVRGQLDSFGRVYHANRPIVHLV